MSEQEQPMPGDLLDTAYRTPVGLNVNVVLEVLYQVSKADTLHLLESLRYGCPVCGEPEKLIRYSYYNIYLDVRCLAAFYCEGCMLVWMVVGIDSYIKYMDKDR